MQVQPGRNGTYHPIAGERCHRGEIKLSVRLGKQPLRDAAMMSAMRRALHDRAKLSWDNVHQTHGYVTKRTRITSGLEKSHRIDARRIKTNQPGLLLKACQEKSGPQRRHQNVSFL